VKDRRIQDVELKGNIHGANRSDHALSLQVLFSAIPHLFSRFVKRLFGMSLALILDGL